MLCRCCFNAQKEVTSQGPGSYKDKFTLSRLNYWESKDHMLIRGTLNKRGRNPMHGNGLRVCISRTEGVFNFFIEEGGGGRRRRWCFLQNSGNSILL